MFQNYFVLFKINVFLVFVLTLLKGKNTLIKFKFSIRMAKKVYLSGTDCAMIVDVKWGGISI